jgi:hypothetical protein
MALGGERTEQPDNNLFESVMTGAAGGTPTPRTDAFLLSSDGFVDLPDGEAVLAFCRSLELASRQPFREGLEAAAKGTEAWALVNENGIVMLNTVRSNEARAWEAWTLSLDLKAHYQNDGYRAVRVLITHASDGQEGQA